MKNVEFLYASIIIDGKVKPDLIDLGSITLRKNNKEYMLDIIRTMIYWDEDTKKTTLECQVERDDEVFEDCKYDLTENGLLNVPDVAEIFVGGDGEYSPISYTLHVKVGGVEKEIPLVSEVTDIENKCQLTNSDVLNIAKSLHFVTPTTKQINEVLKEVDSQADTDPTGWFGVWIEDLLENIGVDKE